MTHYNLDGIFIGIILGIVTAVCAITVSKRWVFKSFRVWAKGTGVEWFYELTSCHWCLSFWIGAFWNLLFAPSTIIGQSWVVNALASQFWIFAIATITLALVFDRGASPAPAQS